MDTEQISGVKRLTQDEAHYVAVAKSADVSCETCRWFDKKALYCGIVKSTPDDILPEGSCDRHEAKDITSTPATVEIVETVKIEAVIEPVEVIPAETTVTANPAPTIIQRVKQLFAGKPDSSPFQVFKAADGQHYWLARHTNNFEDRDKEILSQKAHEAYVARVNLGFVPPPELWAYHTKGTRHGVADVVWMHENFVFALGHFDDTPEAKQAVKWYQSQKGNIELSHGFTFPKWALKDGVYETYNTFEITTLPTNAASNPYTAFEEINTMALSEKQANWVKSTLGEAGLKRVLDAQSTAEKDADVLKAIDARYKDFVETTPSESIEAGSGEVIKTLLADMIAVQALVMEQVEGFKADRAVEQDAFAVKAKADGDAIAELTSIVNALKVQLDARPKSASTADETKIDKSALPPEVTNANVEIDPFWRVPVKGE